MSTAFWQTKIKALLHHIDPFVCCAADQFPDRYRNWLQVAASPDPTVDLADAIASASDRAILSQLHTTPPATTFQATHLLDGAFLPLSTAAPSEWQALRNSQSYEAIAGLDLSQLQELFWWLWRCLPDAACRHWQDEQVFLCPQDVALPDVSVWSHRSIAAAIAGALTGHNDRPQIPHLVHFSFSPVQELIKASRKLRDFWAGSWILHYLSARVCWALAQKYGPDSLIYPSLYGQPLIDHWLQHQRHRIPATADPWPDVQAWLNTADTPYQRRRLLTAGFPNVITVILPGDAVSGAMAMAKQVLLQEVWCDELGRQVFQELADKRWTRNLTENSKTWREWLLHQWQTSWLALPLSPAQTHGELRQTDGFQAWAAALNRRYGSTAAPFTQPEEIALTEAIARQQDRPPEINIGSWWSQGFECLRQSASIAKLNRHWKIPTVFLPRSSISGVGPALYDRATDRHVSEGEVERYWQRDAGLFDGTETLNATEVLKRVIHQILPQLLDPPNSPAHTRQDYMAAYPDLSSGVAGWLRHHPQCRDFFGMACDAITDQFDWAAAASATPWGIPWVDENPESAHWPNPRLLNAGWLMDDYPVQSDSETDKDEKQREIKAVRGAIAQYFRPGNNPTDWYVLGAGDGDNIGQWLSGEKLAHYGAYMPNPIEAGTVAAALDAFKTQVQKRMGPSTHSAFSRALLDFSNQLVPHITEKRYAGRLIYGGGDDVLAYTNLWEWDRWLWDIRQCFRGDVDPEYLRGDVDAADRFMNEGHYWKIDNPAAHPHLSQRPLFTVGIEASASFGIAIAHHSVPLAIALENLWAAEEGAKHYQCHGYKKDAVQVRVLFGNGNILQATSRFSVFNQWQQLLDVNTLNIEASIYEQAAQLWTAHPIPNEEAILPWTHAFCQRREMLTEDNREEFRDRLALYLRDLLTSTMPNDQATEVQNWLKLAAFMLRHRDIKPVSGGQSS